MLTEEQRRQIDYALDMLLCAMRAANWKGDAAYIAGEKARAVLAAHSAGAQEPVAEVINYRDVDGDLRSGIRFLGEALEDGTSLYAHPQPITDAARDELIASVIHLARQQWQGNFVYTPEQVRTKLAEIERLDRAKGE